MHSVDISNKGDSVFTARSKGHEFSIDTKGETMGPSDVMLASLGACIGVYMRRYTESAKLDLGEFNIKVESAFVKEPKVHFKNIRVHIDLKNSKLDERRKASLLSFIKNCPIHNTLKSNPDINVEIG